MKAKLEFTLPEEQTEHYQAVKAGEAFCVLSAMREAFRAALKWGNLSESAYKEVDRLQALFFEELEGLNIDN